MKRLGYFCVFLAITLALAGCGGGASGGGGGFQSGQGAVFVTGEDAPLPSVVAFNITLNTLTLNNSNGSVQVLAQPTTVDFARLVGMRSFLGFNTVAPGTYTSATITMASPVISYLNIGTNPPTVNTLNGTLTNSTVTVSFAHPMVVDQNGLAGLHMDFDLRQSLQTDMAGQITGTVDPHILLQVVRASDDDGQITDLNGGLVSINISNGSFVMQR